MRAGLPHSAAFTLLVRIPFARGLGSSSAAIVGGIVAGLVLAGKELTVWGAEELLQIVSIYSANAASLIALRPFRLLGLKATQTMLPLPSTGESNWYAIKVLDCAPAQCFWCPRAFTMESAG
jgi:hypothetical protein